MSARCTGQVFDRYPAGGGEFALALALADNAHDDGTHIFPSVETMARKSRQDVRSVQRHLKRMQALGWLILVKPGGGRGRAAEYRISPRWLKGEELDAIAPNPHYMGESKKGDKSPPFSESEGDAGKGGKVSPIRADEFAGKRVTPATRKGDNRNTPYRNRKEPHTPLTPQGGASFDALCKEYPAHRVNAHQALKRWRQLQPDERLAALMVRAARAQAASPEWQANNGHAVPNLSGWILNSKWRATHDEREAPAARTAVTSNQGDQQQQQQPELSEEEREEARQRAIAARERLREISEASKGRRGMATA